MTLRLLPDGTRTEDATELQAAWDAVIKPAERALNLICVAFGPDVVLVTDVNAPWYTLSVDMCRTIGRLIERVEELEAALTEIASKENDFGWGYWASQTARNALKGKD